MILGNKKRSRYIAGVAVSTALMPFSLQTSLADEVWLEEIVVTAQKRLETAQEVPIAISAFSEDMIKNIGAQNIRDLGRFTPGLEANNPSDTQPIYSIRGIQTQDVAIGTDPAVAVYIDGVYVGRSGGAQMNFNDIERVEILRGPQGTLFGRNAAAGAISIITKKPTALTEGNVMATIGNYNKLKLEGIYNTELTDDVYGRFGAVWNQRDGFIDNDDPSGRGQDTLGQEGNWSLVGSVLWDTIDDTEIIWRMEYDKLDKDAPYAYSLNPNLYHNEANGKSGPYGDTYENDSPSFEKRTLWGSSLTVNHDFNDDLSFISITSFRTFESDNREDEDGTAIIGRYFDTHNMEDNDSFSQEFRLSYHSDGAWSWSTGVSYFHEKAEQEHRVIFSTDMADLLLAAGLDGANPDGVIPDDQLEGGDGVPVAGFDAIEFVNTNAGIIYGLGIPGSPSADELLAIGTHTDQMYNDLTFTSYAWYGDITYTFTDQWDLTLGLRYTNDKKDFKRSTPVNREGFAYRFAFDSYENSNGLDFLDKVGEFLDVGGSLPAAPDISHSDSQDDTWSKWTPRAVLNYRITPQMMTYLSASSGFKAGGYNGVGFTPKPFEQETVENYELGYKSTWFDSRLRFNVAAFYYEYNDLQILEYVKLPDTSLSQHYLGNGDARARGLETEVQWMVKDSLMLTFNSAYLDTEYVKYVKATSTGYRNLADEPMSTVPRETYNLGAEYTMTAGDLGDFIFRFDTSYIGSRIDNTGEKDKTIGSYALTNARITYAHVSGDWEASLWADNLFDKDYLLGGTQSLAESEANSPMVRRGTPRFWGVDYRHYF